MKTITSMFISAALVMVGVSPAQAGDRFTISGTVPGVNDSVKVVLMTAERENPDKLAETFTTDGTFTLTETVKMPMLCRLAIQRKGKDGSFRSAASPRIMVENSDMTVSFVVPLDSLRNSYAPEQLMRVSGSESQRQFDEYLTACSDAEVKAKKAGYLSAEKYFATHADKDTMRVYDGLKKVANAELLALKHRFIAEHPEYHISSVLAFQEMMKDFVYTDAELVDMGEKIMACPDTARVSLNKRALEWSRKYALGMRYPDFTLNDTEGNSHKFSGYVTPGKYTFIDFWASWCGPCRSAIPHVRQLREQYGDRMNVYSISCDESEGAWRKAMDQEKMEWTQLRLTPDQMGEAANLYCLSAIPRLIVLDGEGRIVCSTNLPDEVDEYLKENL